MPKRKNGGDENLFSKIGKATRSVGSALGSAGASELKKAAVIKTIEENFPAHMRPRISGAEVGKEIMQEYKPMLVTRLIESKEPPMSKPLQPRQHFDTRTEINIAKTPFRDMDIQRIQNIGGQTGSSSVSQPSQRIAD